MRYYVKTTDKPFHTDFINLIDEITENLLSEVNNYQTDEPKNNKQVAKSNRPKHKHTKNFKPLYMPELSDVMFRDPATIAWFDDGTKTVSVAGHGDKYDKETGLAICMIKRILGNKEYRAIMDSWCYDNKEK